MTLPKDKRILTIGFPTYDREPFVLEQVKLTHDSGLLKKIKLLVVNDNPDKDLSDKISQISKSSSITIINNSKNIGYAASFLKILENTDTQYLLYNADDGEPLKTHHAQK